MSRLQTPLESFEPDEIDLPAFAVPARTRTPRVAPRRDDNAGTVSSRSNSRGTASGRVPVGQRPAPPRPAPPRQTASRNRLDDAGPVRASPVSDWEDDPFVPPPPRAPKTAPKSKTSRATARPKTELAVRNPAPRPKPVKAPRPPFQFLPLHFEIGGIALFALGALLAYNASLPHPDGFLPRWMLHGLRYLCGVGAQVVPYVLCFLGAALFVRHGTANLRPLRRGALLLFLVLLTYSHLAVPRGDEFEDNATLFSHGGVIGGALAFLLRHAVGEVGAVIVLVATGLVSILLLTEVTVAAVVSAVSSRLQNRFDGARFAWDEHISARESERAERAERAWIAEQEAIAAEEAAEAERAEAGDVAPPPRPSLHALGTASFARLNPLRRRQTKKAPPEQSLELPFEEGLDLPVINRATVRPAPRNSPFFDAEELMNESDGEEEHPVHERVVDEVDPDSTIEAPRFKPVRPASAAPSRPIAPPPVPPRPDTPRIEILDTPPPPSVVSPAGPPPVYSYNTPDEALTPVESLEAQAAASAADGPVRPARLVPELPRRHFGEGPLMPFYFDEAVRALDAPIPPDVSGVEEDIQRGVASVQETLAAFKIDARVTDVKRGPVITRYEVQPAPGVRVASIANLDRDLARSLAAIAVRIEAPVPGKNVVGIEVPNRKVNLVRMRDVLEQHDFLAHPSKLAFVLGKDIAGQPKWGDLTKMPHLLIAGSTNSGKSVCLNSIIASILVRAQPDEVRFSLIDPKRVELTLYRGIRHLMHDVVVEPKQAVIALRRAIEEMDRRYKLFATRGVRNIASFNAKLQEGEKPMPYIVIVIDELADLMMTAAAEFEKLICRLAQLARATGIHLIVATQRPSVNVITGVIKANIPARIAFAVASQVDSRTILDSVGAERLIGSGDMLYDSNNGGKSTRIQGAYLSEDEVNRIVDVVKGAYLYDDPELDKLPTFDLYSEDSDDDFSDEKPAAEERRDDLYDAIKEFVLRHQEMSASMIQRKFEIGYPRAGRIVDQLERDGVVGPADGPKPRKVLGSGRP